MKNFLALIILSAVAIGCNNNATSNLELNDEQLVGNWQLLNTEINFSLYKNGLGSFEKGETPNTKSEIESRINWMTTNGHTLHWDFFKNKNIWSYWLNGDTLNIYDSGIGSFGHPTIDESWQFVRLK